MALTLSRKAGQGIWIGDNVHIKITKVVGGKATIAVSAPRKVCILRDELEPKQGGNSNGQASR
jgi:carbon storage regulator CsrA